MIPSHNPPFKPGQRIALLDLAPELIILICKSSEDWGAVFALKKVCRSLNKILNDGTIWAHLVSTCVYSPSRLTRHLFVDRPIGTYSACELRAMLVRWKKVERGWKRAHRQDFSLRMLSLPAGFIAQTRVLAPGGRWLLVFSKNLSASYFDLDCMDMEPLPLIPPHNPYGATSLHVSDPDVDQVSPVISFRIALTYVAAEDMAEGPSFIEIWNITSLYDSNANTSHLNARKVAAFCLDLACGLLDIYTLAGDNILFVAPYMFMDTPEYVNGDLRLLHINWRKAMNDPHQPCYRTVLLPARDLWGATIIDEDKLLVSTDSGIKLVDSRGIPERSISECHHYHQPASLSNVNYGLETIITSEEFCFMSYGYCHDPQLTGRIKKIFFANQEGRFAAVTCHCGDATTNANPPSFSTGNFSLAGLSSVLFGHKSVIFMSGSSVTVVPDALLAAQNDDTNIPLQRAFETCITFFSNNRLDCFDETIGRILIYSIMEGVFHIADMIV